MCIPPQDNSGRGPTAGQALSDTVKVMANGYTSTDQLKQSQSGTQAAAPGAAAAPQAAAPPPTAQTTLADAGSTKDDLMIPLTGRTAALGGVGSAGSGLNIPS